MDVKLISTAVSKACFVPLDYNCKVKAITVHSECLVEENFGEFPLRVKVGQILHRLFSCKRHLNLVGEIWQIASDSPNYLKFFSTKSY